MDKKEKEILVEILLQMKYGFTYYDDFDKEESCDICLDSLKDKPVFETPCKHRYDYECLMVTLINFKLLRCPTCNLNYELVEPILQK